jgi:hypothetical protein
VCLQDLAFDSSHRIFGRLDLIQDIYAVLAFIDHLLDALDLTADTSDAWQLVFMACVFHLLFSVMVYRK